MSRTKRENFGILSGNAFKTKPSQPDLIGSAKIMGSAYRVAGWVVKDGDATRISLSFSINIPKHEDDFSDGGHV